MNSLQALTDCWGKWKAANIGTFCNFTCSTSYSDQSKLDQYHQYQCSAVYSAISYSAPTMTDGAVIVQSQTLQNSGNAAQSQTFSWSTSTTNTFTWSVTEALMVGVTVSGGADIPFVAEGKVSATVELTLSSTQSVSKTQSDTWTLNNPVNVLPHTMIVCQSEISTNQTKMDFTALSTVTGYVAVWFNDKVNGHWLWFYPIGGVLQDILANHLIDVTGYQVLSDSSISAAALGTCVGGFGVNVVTTYTETEIPQSGSAPKSDIPQVYEVYSGTIAGT